MQYRPNAVRNMPGTLSVKRLHSAMMSTARGARTHCSSQQATGSADVIRVSISSNSPHVFQVCPLALAHKVGLYCQLLFVGGICG